MLNHITLQGRLVRDPILRRTPNGKAVTSFTLAVDRDFTANGKQTDFIPVVAWENKAEFVSKYFLKGAMATVSGRLQIREYTDKDGKSRTTAEVLAESIYFGESKKSGTAEFNASNNAVEFEEVEEVDEGTLPF